MARSETAKATKTAEYPVRLVGKNQITLPRQIVEANGLERGDELVIEIHGPGDIRLVPCTRVRRDLITPEIEAILKKRRAEIRSGAVRLVSQAEVHKRAAVKNALRRAARKALAVSAEQQGENAR
jgi:bifunctional DNA-binding transcriptional regulator/antitoxin component of YhaV-PrlF toxin-antitoxin module